MRLPKFTFYSFKTFLKLSRHIFSSDWNKFLLVVLVLCVVLDWVFATRTQGLASFVVFIVYAQLTRIAQFQLTIEENGMEDVFK